MCVDIINKEWRDGIIGERVGKLSEKECVKWFWMWKKGFLRKSFKNFMVVNCRDGIDALLKKEI